jgi:hypothetical protein
VLGHLLRHPQKKRIVDVKGFIKEWDQSSNHRSDGKERIASYGILHSKVIPG